MSFSILLHPILVALAYPLLFIGLGLMVYLWKLPPVEGYSESEIVKKPNPRGTIYVASTWQPAVRPEPYKVTVREEPADRHPIFDELEQGMRARMAAYEFLLELSQKEKQRQLQPA